MRSAFYVHQKKGTISALRRVVEPLGYLIEVDEWWQQVPLGTPGTFALCIGVLDTCINDAMYTELTRLIDDAKPLTRHITGLDLLGESRGPLYLGIAIYDGHETTVTAPDTQSAGPLYLGAGLDVIDTTTASAVSFPSARRLAESQVYYDQDKTFYCSCNFTFEGGPSLDSCGYQVRKQLSGSSGSMSCRRMISGGSYSAGRKVAENIAGQPIQRFGERRRICTTWFQQSAR